MYKNPFPLIITLIIVITYACLCTSCKSSEVKLPKQTKYYKKSIQYSHCSMY